MIASCIFCDMFKVKCLLSGVKSVLSKTDECESDNILLGWLLNVLRQFVTEKSVEWLSLMRWKIMCHLH